MQKLLRAKGFYRNFSTFFKMDEFTILVEIYRPILKWIGGKTQIVDKIFESFPSEIESYHEIFLGGGSVLLNLLAYQEAGIITIKKKIYAYDANISLIYVYKNIQLNPERLYKIIKKYIKEYNSIEPHSKKSMAVNRKPENLDEALESQESYYYWIRDKYNHLNNKKSFTNSAMFIFLNKTCFRGMYRVGPNGFNVPFGNYKNPSIISKSHLLQFHKIIKNVIFTDGDFHNTMSNIQAGDFVYMDPPYAPQEKTSFVGYNKDGFALNNHMDLFNLCHKLKNNNIDFVMSNADVKLIRDNFSDSQYLIKTIVCRRAINSKKPGSSANEVIIQPM